MCFPQQKDATRLPGSEATAEGSRDTLNKSELVPYILLDSPKSDHHDGSTVAMVLDRRTSRFFVERCKWIL